MSAPESLEKLVGQWRGTGTLFQPWTTPAESKYESTAMVALAALGKFITIAYKWVEGEKPQEGLLLLGCENKNEEVSYIWIDSWHMSDKAMVCKGKIDSEGVITLVGSYEAPPGPDWGWRTVIVPVSDESFKILMYNVTPEGEEAIAVENLYSRTG
jgi:hypothetical protein